MNSRPAGRSDPPTRTAAWGRRSQRRRAVGLLEHLRGPCDLKRLTPPELAALAEEIRAELLRVIPRNGGHYGPNLGAVELTLALHRAFDSPRDRLFWDVGHQ